MNIFQRAIKKVTNRAFANAEQALHNGLARIPFVLDVEIREKGNKDNDPLRWTLDAWNLEIMLTLRDGERLRILANIASKGEPRNIRYIAARLQQEKSYSVIIAPYLSEKSAAICEEAGVGYIDHAGNCLLSFGNVYICKSGAEPPPREKRNLHSLFYPKSERVLRVLLNAPHRDWKIKSLAQEAEVSIGQAHNVIEGLKDKEFLTTTSSASMLDEPDALLAEWAKNYRYKRNATYNFYSLQSAHDVEYDLAEMCRQEGISYALTGFSGAARYAFYAQYRTATAYVDGDIDTIAERLKLKPVSDGANVTLLTPYDAGVFYGAEEIEGARVVSPIQVYLDVSAMRGRGEDAAKYLLEEVIRRRWQEK